MTKLLKFDTDAGGKASVFYDDIAGFESGESTYNDPAKGKVTETWTTLYLRGGHRVYVKMPYEALEKLMEDIIEEGERMMQSMFGALGGAGGNDWPEEPELPTKAEKKKSH